MASSNFKEERAHTPSRDGTLEGVKHFYIFGQGIAFSVSPTIHLAGFRYYNLLHTYEIHQIETVDELYTLVSSPFFGGASVAMPHKLAIGKFCSTMTEHARVIGAANTLEREDMTITQLRGDNTDWTGLVEILEQKSKNLCNAPELDS
jgi:shikimate 5-dehydrogenase